MESHRLHDQNIDYLLIHIKQTNRLLRSTFLKTIKQLNNVAWKKHIFYENRKHFWEMAIFFLRL